MNVREAIKALAEGHKVEDCEGDVWSMSDDGRVYRKGCGHGLVEFGLSGPFKMHVAPATDEELIAEMERLGHGLTEICAAYKYCARMLKTRKVKP